jgi:hypothetical protein
MRGSSSEFHINVWHTLGTSRGSNFSFPLWAVFWLMFAESVPSTVNIYEEKKSM